MNRIEVNIAGTKLPVKVSEDEEALVKKTVEEINRKIKQYQSEFSRMDSDDCVKMALLTYAVDYHKNQARAFDETSWNKLLDIRNKIASLSR